MNDISFMSTPRPRAASLSSSSSLSISCCWWGLGGSKPGHIGGTEACLRAELLWRTARSRRAEQAVTYALACRHRYEAKQAKAEQQQPTVPGHGSQDKQHKHGMHQTLPLHGDSRQKQLYLNKPSFRSARPQMSCSSSCCHCRQHYSLLRQWHNLRHLPNLHPHNQHSVPQTHRPEPPVQLGLLCSPAASSCLWCYWWCRCRCCAAAAAAAAPAAAKSSSHAMPNRCCCCQLSLKQAACWPACRVPGSSCHWSRCQRQGPGNHYDRHRPG